MTSIKNWEGKRVTQVMFLLGESYWLQYVKLNGYSFEPTQKGLEKLSRNLDLNIPHLREYINYFLEA